MNLSQLQIGESAKIKIMPQNDPLSMRLKDMGCRENMTVKIHISNKSLTVFQIGETLFDLKKNECDKILIVI